MSLHSISAARMVSHVPCTPKNIGVEVSVERSAGYEGVRGPDEPFGTITEGIAHKGEQSQRRDLLQRGLHVRREEERVCAGPHDRRMARGGRRKSKL